MSWWPAEPHKSNTCTHKDRKREIKKIPVKDLLPCCLVKYNSQKAKKEIKIKHNIVDIRTCAVVWDQKSLCRP